MRQFNCLALYHIHIKDICVQIFLVFIQILRKKQKFSANDNAQMRPCGTHFLFFLGGKIDHGHHSGKAQKALVDYVAFDSAIGEGRHFTSEKDTLIVVTADHSHV